MEKVGLFSKRFLEATPEKQREYVDAALVTDRTELPDHVREALERADQEVAERWKGKLSESTVIDMRNKKQAG